MLYQQSVPYQIISSCQKQLCIERFAYIVIRPTIQPLNTLLRIVERSKQNNRNMAQINIILYLQAHFNSSHFRHHNI